jgi:hypothetical protein
MNVSFAKALIENYAQNHWTTLNNDCPSILKNPEYPNVQDSRSVWFSLADLQNFISEFQQSGSLSQLGVRIYFGEHKAELSPNQDAQYSGLHTLLMLPTLLGADGYNHDFDPATGSSDFSKSVTICALNHGSMIPPPFTINGSPEVNVGDDFMLFCDGI